MPKAKVAPHTPIKATDASNPKAVRPAPRAREPRAPKIVPAKPVVPMYPSPPCAVLRGQTLLETVRHRRVQVEITRDSQHHAPYGLFWRGNIFLIVGKDHMGWIIQAPGPDGEPTGRRCSRVQSSSLRLLEEVPREVPS